MTIYYQDYPMSGRVYKGAEEITTAEELEMLKFGDGILNYVEFHPRFSFHMVTYASPAEPIILEVDGRRFKAEVSFQRDTKRAAFKKFPQEIH